MDTKYIDLVATYEEVLKVPQHEATTAYFGDLSLHYIKSEEAMKVARGIKDKALELLGMTQEEFDAKPEFIYRGEIRKAFNDSLGRFRCINECSDKNYLFQKLSVSELQTVENILKAYSEGEIDLDIPRDADTEEINFDGDFNLVINEQTYKEIGIEVTVLKWYESLEDTGYMVDVVQAKSDASHELSQDDTEQTTVTTTRTASESFEVVEIFNKPVLFTNERLKLADIPDGMFRYDIRHDDDCQGNMVELKDHVMVNHWATVICKEPFDITQEFNGHTYTTANGITMTADDYNYTGEVMTIEQYVNSYDELLRECNQDIEQTTDEMGGMSMG